MNAEIHTEFFEALSRADEDTAIRIATGLVDAGTPVPEVLAELVAPAQRRVGAYWADNRWNVAREHAATHICDRVVAALGLRVRPAGPSRGRVVLACVDGEWHALSARMVGESLRAAGWEVTFLGASTPAGHLAQFVHEIGPDAVALSCSVSTSLPRARAMIVAARHVGVPVLTGGPGFGPEGRWALRLGADAWAPDGAAAAVRLSDDWPAYTDPAPDLDLPDDEHLRLAAARTILVDGVMAGVVEDYTAEQTQDTRDDFGHIVDFLGAALLVDDAELFETFTGWLVEILQARGVPPQAVAAGYDLLAAELTGFPRAARLLAVARAGLPGDRVRAG